MHKIGDIIEHRADGSVVYMSHRGVLNLDAPYLLYNRSRNEWYRVDELGGAMAEDKSFLSTGGVE